MSENKVKIQLKHLLKILSQNARKEFSRTPIAVLVGLVGIFAILLPILLNVFPTGSVLYLIQGFLLKTIILNRSLLIIVFLVLLYAFVALFKKHQKINLSNEYFIDYDGFSWKVDCPNDKSYRIDYPPNCIKHRKKVTITLSEILCPVCTNKLTKHITPIELKHSYDCVNSLSKNEYFKNRKT